MRTEESQPYGQEDCSEAKHLTKPSKDLLFQRNLGGAACKTKSREDIRCGEDTRYTR